MKKVFQACRFLLAPIICAAVILVLAKFVFFIGYVPSASMEPTIESGSYILGWRLYSDISVGDVVIFEHEGKTLVKRVAAVGGESIELGSQCLTVPENCYVVLGDNADVSIDSRYWSDPFLSRDGIRAKLLLPGTD